MQRYFCKDLNNNIFTLSNDDSYHIKTVMRKAINDKIEVVYNSNIYICIIIDTSNNIKCSILEKLEYNSTDMCSVTIAQALVKEQKMDYILQKSCELGVNTIIPLNVSRSIIKISNKEEKKINRWKIILKEASEQSKRNDIPDILPIMGIKEISALNYDYKILCTVNETSINIKKVLSNIKSSDTILIVVGPEGGFTSEEENILIKNGFISTTLGNRVLRTESVSLFVLSVINYIFTR